MLKLDLPTILAVIGVVYAGTGVIMLLIWRETPAVPGLARVALSHGVTAVGAVLVAFKGTAPDLLAIVLANTLLVYAAALRLEGTRLFFGLPARRIVTVSSVGLAAFLFFRYAVIAPNERARIIVFSSSVV